MSAVTLEILRAEFEAARSTYICLWADHSYLNEMTADYVGQWNDALVSASFVEKVAMLQAARRYIIARDFGEFDPDRSDMIWKMANGGVQ